MLRNRLLLVCAACLGSFLPSAFAQSGAPELLPLDAIFLSASGDDECSSSPALSAMGGLAVLGDRGGITEARLMRAMSRAFVLANVLSEFEDHPQRDEMIRRLLDLDQRVDWKILEQVTYADFSAVRAIEEELDTREQASEQDVPDRVADAYTDLLVRRFQHETSMMDERASVIRITNLISWIIFVVAHLVLFFGVWASAREFIHANRTRLAAPEPPKPTTGVGVFDATQAAAIKEMQEIKVSLEGVALKTSLHGVILLAMAIGFYFLYLKFVYPIATVGA